MPHAPVSEKYLLSTLMHEPGKFVPRAAADGIDQEAFYLPAHRLGFECIRDHYLEHGNFDLTLFVQAQAISGNLDAMGGAACVSDWCTYAPDRGGQWTGHSEILREMKARRLAANAATRLSAASDSIEAMEETAATLAALQAIMSGPRRAATGKESVDGFSEALTAAYQAGNFPGAETGFAELDQVSGGMRPGELWVACGKPSRGKSVFLIQVAADFLKRGSAVAIFSLEMMRSEIVGRLVSCWGRVDYGQITQPRTLTRDGMDRIQATAKVIAESSLWLDDGAGQSLETIAAEATRIRDCNGHLDLVAVDYLQLVRGGRQRGETREEEVARLSGGLKQLAKSLRCPVLTASQLNEQGQTRESRAIEQDADALLFICEDGIKVGKLRNGQRNGLLPLFLDGRHQRFTEGRNIL